MKILRRSAIAVGVLALVVVALFVANGTSGSWREAEVGSAPGSVRDGPVREVRVLAFNAAKFGFHRGGIDFASAEEVQAELDELVAVLKEHRPDVVCLSEVVMESATHDFHQVRYLAERAGYPRWAASENYSFGIPGFRIRSGNAVLSRFDVCVQPVQQLAGGTPYWSPTGNRRALWFELHVDGQWLLGASIRNDSFDLANNLTQVEEMLARIGDRPALVAGDFNAEPGTAPMQRWLENGKFSGFAAAPPTFPARAPARRIDQVLAPATWRAVDTTVLRIGASDHLAVLARFELN